MTWRVVADWLKATFDPEQAHPPDMLGAEEDDIVASAEESRVATERLAAAHQRYQEAQRQRLQLLEERVSFFEQLGQTKAPRDVDDKERK